jgi:group I intron endonuclease
MASLYTLSLKSDILKVRYVGITKYDDVSKRLRAHREKAGKVNRPVADWLAKYGDEVVATKVAGGLTWEEACAQEVALIHELRLSGFSLLNITSGGDGSLGREQSAETKQKRSDSLRGHDTSDETKLKISKANTGKKRSAEAKKKMSDAKIGKSLSLEHRKKISNAGKGRTVSKETRELISSSQRGRKLSEEHLTNLRESQKRRRQREAREKLNDK